MRRNRARLAITIFAAVALSTAPAALGQAVHPVAPIIVAPPVTTPLYLPPNCGPGSANSGTPCSSLPPLTPAPPLLPIPVAPAVPASPQTALTPGSARDISAVGDDKVLSYFQRSVTQVDTRKAFGFVLLPKSAVTAEEKRLQGRFCQIMLASMDFMAPDAVARRNILVTYWPVVAARKAVEIEAAFAERNCDQLLAWYDYKLARSVAARAGIAGLSGPLLITWPSEDAKHAAERDPLIVDFAKADYEHATKALQYWFGELRNKPALWTSRIREGTIRAELADAINDTAGVVLAMLSGKWESVTAVSETP